LCFGTEATLPLPLKLITNAGQDKDKENEETMHFMTVQAINCLIHKDINRENYCVWGIFSCFISTALTQMEDRWMLNQFLRPIK
jgi:hypothetical protein